MNTISQKLDLIRWITELDDDTTLNVLEIIKNQSTQEDWWNTISDAEKESIAKGLADVKAGRTITHLEVKKRYEKWLI
ncbi:MAG: hypothetical protein LBR10_12480 [Prevotellaceae bacterium]|jgi:predicted transcriptional regulator|nr:hypothetical protein [Prevotellaceae bacterium]